MGKSGRGFRRGGKFTGRGGNSGKSETPKKKKTLEEYVYYTGSGKQSADFEQTTEYIINHIQESFDKKGGDIAAALKNLQHLDLDQYEPTLKVSSKTDAAEKERENKQYEMKYNRELTLFLERKEQYEDNKKKAYAVLWKQCSLSMQQLVKNRKDFESDIEDDPVALLKRLSS